MMTSLAKSMLRESPGALLIGASLVFAPARGDAQSTAGSGPSAGEIPTANVQDQSEEVAEEAIEGTDEPEGEKKKQRSLLWKGLIQGGYVRRWGDQPGPANEFRLREAQISVEGSPIPDTHFFIELNFPGPGEKVELNDAAVTFDVAEGVRVVAGQLRVPLNRPAVSARTSLFLTEPRAAGPVQRKARDRGVNLVLTPFDGRLLYEQAIVNGNGIQTKELGNDNDSLLLQGRLVWFATGEWPLPLPAQTNLKNSPWSTFFKMGWATGKFEKGLEVATREQVRETTWNVGQAVVGKGLYGYWQYSQANASGGQNFDSDSFSVTTGYAFPLRRFLRLAESSPRFLRDGWLEPKLQYETLGFRDSVLSDQLGRKIYRFGANYYPLGIPDIRIMVDHEVAVRPRRSDTLSVSFHYMF